MLFTHSKHIPLAYSLISAGAAVEIQDDGYGLLDINALVTKNRDCIAFIVTGDSMMDTIQPGNLVFVDPHREPRNGDIVVVSINGANCIKIFERTERNLYLVPNNDDHPVREVHASDSFHVLGVVKAHLAVY